MRVLVVNAGSSSLKLRVVDEDDRLLAARDLPGGATDEERRLALGRVAGETTVDAVGHRVVHGGTRFTTGVPIDAAVRAAIESLRDLAPLHQPPALAGIDAAADALPGIPNVACFDTAFHSTLPPAAATYAIPDEWRTRYGIRRFGFHGLSHAYVSRRAAQIVEREVRELRIVTCHLGAGASLAAIAGGRSIDTTMGFTPLEGLVMATRAGSIDPGVPLWLQEHAGMSAAEVLDALEHGSGLVGLAGTADMRSLLRRAQAGDPAARLALDVYVHRASAAIATMVTALGGLDVLAFTGGVGERSAEVRRLVADRLAFLGVAVDEHRSPAEGDRDITAAGAPVRTLVVEAREDIEIAREVRRVLAPGPT